MKDLSELIQSNQALLVPDQNNNLKRFLIGNCTLRQAKAINTFMKSFLR